MRGIPYRSSFCFLFFCYAAGLLWGLCTDGSGLEPWPEAWLWTLWGLGLAAVGVLCGSRRPMWRAVAAVCLAVGGGYANVALSRAAGGRLPEACLDGGKRLYDVEVLDFGKETAKSWKKTVRVWAYAGDDGAWRPTRAKLCLYFQKDGTAAALAPGDRLTVRAAPAPFDTAAYAGYARYMHRRYIYASAYVPRGGWGFVGTDSASGAGRHTAHRLRRAAGRLQARLAA
ncbi:MAG: DUF4131 domain-containing protein, partial [Bacteroidales bacterium]|nr:DUF4131 domain-containing protein [Bacteroidales bacterium]